MSYKFFDVEIENKVATLWLNQPDRLNAMAWDFWAELPGVCRDLDANPEVAVVVIAGRGKCFSTGLDLEEFIKIFEEKNLFSTPTAEQRFELRRMIREMQAAINAVSALEKPVIAAIHRHCIGGGLDLISACDIRLCSTDAVFSLREAKVAIVADMGSLQRLPAIIGEGNTRRLAFTGENIRAERAREIHLVDEIFEDQEKLLAGARKLAGQIARNSGLVLQGIKAVMNTRQAGQLEKSLDYVVTWNSAFLDSQEFFQVMQSFKKKLGGSN